MTSRKALLLAGAACLTLAAALGILFARPVLAQLGGNATALRVATLPRLSELWRVGLDYPGATWEHSYDDQYGSHWFMWFTVPETGRRPVWTDFDAHNPVDYHYVDDQHEYGVRIETGQQALFYITPGGTSKWLRFPREAVEPFPPALGRAAHNGEILPPGTYRVEVQFTGYDGDHPWRPTDAAQAVIEHGFHVDAYFGYWAEP
ncbi:MAG: hypothetical protein AMXMBFR61_25520 [Fimbriimonadales bacterium]